MERTARLLGVGFAFVDLVLPVEGAVRLGEKQIATSIRTAFGGPAAVGAVAAAALGAQSHLFAPVGDDDHGAAFAAALRRAGLSSDGLVVRPGVATGLSIVLIEPSGDRTILSVVDAALSAPASKGVIAEIRAAVRDADAVLADIRWPSATREALLAASETGVPVTLDLDRFDVGDGAELLELVALSTHVFASEEALRQIVDMATPGSTATCTDDLESTRQSLTTLLEISSRVQVPERRARRGGTTFGVTLGARGAVWLDGDGTAHHTPTFRVEARETLGAGDVWHGALALAIARGEGLEEATDFAAAAAAVRCSRTGGWEVLPTETDVTRLRSEGRRGAGLR